MKLKHANNYMHAKDHGELPLTILVFIYNHVYVIYDIYVHA
jgi:hypothetical protein